jgi:hypothetical protein
MVSDPESLRFPCETELVGRCHVAEERRLRDDRRAGEISLAADAHPVLPVPVEGSDRPLHPRLSGESIAEVFRSVGGAREDRERDSSVDSTAR